MSRDVASGLSVVVVGSSSLALVGLHCTSLAVVGQWWPLWVVVKAQALARVKM